MEAVDTVPLGTMSSSPRPKGMSSSSAAESVKVFARYRPFNAREKKLGADKRLNMTVDEGQIMIENEDRMNKFAFDWVFQEDSTQDQVFDRGAKAQVADIFKGFNGTIFAYGQTGAGKTWSMMGNRDREDLMGIIPRATMDIFDAISKSGSDTEFTVSVSYLEVYREQIRDLLDSSGDKANLKIHEHPSKGIYVDRLTKTFCTSFDDVLDVLAIGDTCRAVAATNMNATSSRSHCVFTIMVDMRSDEGSTKVGPTALHPRARPRSLRVHCPWIAAGRFVLLHLLPLDRPPLLRHSCCCTPSPIALIAHWSSITRHYAFDRE